MGVTIKQIAEAAGVSRGTVDRALNNRSGIKKEIAEHVREIAKEMGYRPNPAAKVLADKRYTAKKIGVLLISEGNDYFKDVINGVDTAIEEFKKFGIHYLVRKMKGYSAEKQKQIIEELLQEGIQALVITPINEPEIIEEINRIAQMGVQTVTINTDILDSARTAYVGCQYRKSGTVAAGLFGMMNNGQPEEIGIITGSKKNLAVARRLQGIMETLEEDFPQIKIAEVVENEDSDEISYEKTKELLNRHKDITGICFCAAGFSGGLKAIEENKVDKSVKIVTYDLTKNIRECLLNDRVAATICQDPFKQGYEGVSIASRSVLFGEQPTEEKNYTELSIVTKYSLY
ncbi:MAG: LacI family DNA-binding transcriptional regulator [Lachnospiraceae bacterium]|nr:LacI family DNA-binding transcriptional regulator [Lachnospiraceae bacterium]